MMKRGFILVLCIFTILNTFSQKTIHGTVSDEYGIPIHKVKISIPELKKSILTDENGFYEVRLDEKKQYYTLNFSYQNLFPAEYKFSMITLQNETQLNVTLKSSILSLSLQELMNMNITSATKTPQRATEAPNIVKLFFNEQIESMGWNSINDVLSNQAGYSLTQDYERTTVGYRGMTEGWNNNHILMLIDGIPFNDNLYGTAYTWDITPLTFIKSMEIMKGPNSSLYGNNALNGVVSLNTRKFENSNQLGQVRLGTGNMRTRYFDITMGKESKNFGFVSSVNYMQTDGNEYDSYDDQFLSDSSLTRQKARVQDSRMSMYFFGKIYGKNQYEGLNFQFHEQHWDFETGHGWTYQIPDIPESMSESRRILLLKYAPKTSRIWNYELAAKYQRHNINWNMNYFSLGNPEFPMGVNEKLKSGAQDLFLRAQSSWKLKKKASVLAGVEFNSMFYNGDEIHESNLNLNTSQTATLTGKNYQLGPWLEYIYKQPVHNFSAYIQYISPKVWEKIQLTTDARFDRMHFHYKDIESRDQSELLKTFSLFTYKTSLVYKPTEKLSARFILGRAFRTPAPTEMFGSNTLTLASNLENLEPEIVDSYDISIDWLLNKNLYIELVGYYLIFRNQIAYSNLGYNLSTNIYSLSTAGFESNLTYTVDKFQAYINYSYTHRLNEEILDESVSVSNNHLTWMPAHQFNAGFIYKTKRTTSSLSGHYQGRVYRRDSDFNRSINYYRPESIKPWLNIDGKFSYHISDNIKSSLLVKNLFNTDQYLIKNHAFPFDYRRKKLSIMLELEYMF